jgi:uncharacterized protein YbjT (DUF2867 family)
MATHKILVLGGTGLLGLPTTRRLVGDGFDVRLLARDAERSRKLVPPTVEVIPGDVADAAVVERAMTGCQSVHISVGGSVDQVSAEHVAAAAPTAGVSRITYLSGATVADGNAWFPMVEQKLRAEEALATCGAPVTVLCPTWPMEQLPRFVRDGGAIIFGEQPTPLHWFAAADLARMVSVAHRTPAAAGRRLYVHGPEAMTMRTALERYCRAEHPGVEPTVVPIDAARSMAAAGADPVLGFMVEMMAYFDQAGEGGDSAEADRILGPARITLDAWLADRGEASADQT